MIIKRLDAFLLFLSILAILMQVAVLFIQAIPRFYGTISFIFLIATILYFVMRSLSRSASQPIASDTTQPNAHLESAIAQSTQEPPEITYEYIATRYGIGYEKLSVECAVNDDGSAVIRREVELEAFSNLKDLDTYLLIPERSNRENVGSILHEKIESKTHTVNIQRKLTEFGRLSVVFSISPPLRPGHKMSFSLIERIPKGTFAINLSTEELSQRVSPKKDYFGWNINRPTKHLYLKVFFPANLEPDAFNDEVRYASASGFPADRTHDANKSLPKCCELELETFWPACFQFQVDNIR